MQWFWRLTWKIFYIFHVYGIINIMSVVHDTMDGKDSQEEETMKSVMNKFSPPIPQHMKFEEKFNWSDPSDLPSPLLPIVLVVHSLVDHQIMYLTLSDMLKVWKLS